MLKPFYQDNHNTIYCQDFRKNDLPDESVQMVCTSPPYWGLRKYSGEQELIWDGDKDCEHEWRSSTRIMQTGGVSDKQMSNKGVTGEGWLAGNDTCSLCGAWKGAYGLEPTPEMYIEHTIEILREIRRVLRKDGVVFWNCGDSYCSDSSVRNTGKEAFSRKGDEGYKEWLAPNRIESGNVRKNFSQYKGSGLKPKDLCLIPFRVAIAAQEDGWWVRSVIIWSKPNPMPESVTDRPTESHEYILMLTKNAKYYWDADAVREKGFYPAGEIRRGGEDHKEFMSDSRTTHGLHAKDWIGNGGRNIRTVWEFPTQPYPEAHFAVFPEKLPELCIKAATPEVGCCSKCGAPWVRVTDIDYIPAGGRGIEKTLTNEAKQSGQAPGPQGYKYGRANKSVTTKGWQPTCKCNADKVPSVVLDPFMGAGTSLWVAKKLNRKAVGYEISEEYCKLSVERLRQQVLL